MMVIRIELMNVIWVSLQLRFGSFECGVIEGGASFVQLALLGFLGLN